MFWLVFGDETVLVKISAFNITSNMFHECIEKLHIINHIPFLFFGDTIKYKSILSQNHWCYQLYYVVWSKFHNMPGSYGGGRWVRYNHRHAALRLILKSGIEQRMLSIYIDCTNCTLSSQYTVRIYCLFIKFSAFEGFRN